MLWLIGAGIIIVCLAAAWGAYSGLFSGKAYVGIVKEILSQLFKTGFIKKPFHIPGHPEEHK